MTITVAGLKAALAAAQGPSQDASIQDSANQALADAIVNYLKSNAIITCTILAGTIATPGDIGPPTNVSIAGTLS